MRVLARLAVNSQLHGEVVRVRNLISGDNPRTKRAEGVNGFAETENAGLHFAALDVARGDVVENHVAANVTRRIFRGEVLAALLQHDG